MLQLENMNTVTCQTSSFKRLIRREFLSFSDD